MLTVTVRDRVDPVSVLTRDIYREIALYPALPDRVGIDLSDNTNLWGAPPAALRALEPCETKTSRGIPLPTILRSAPRSPVTSE